MQWEYGNYCFHRGGGYHPANLEASGALASRESCVFRHIRTAKPETSGHRSGNIRTVNRHYPDTLSNEFCFLQVLFPESCKIFFHSIATGISTMLQTIFCQIAGTLQAIAVCNSSPIQSQYL